RSSYGAISSSMALAAGAFAGKTDPARVRVLPTGRAARLSVRVPECAVARFGRPYALDAESPAGRTLGSARHFFPTSARVIPPEVRGAGRNGARAGAPSSAGAGAGAGTGAGIGRSCT